MCLQVPQLFYENFDYQTIEDFIDGILIDEELLSNQIHTHILGSRCYLSSARTPLAYHCINTDVMERWSYPYVPDTNLKQSPSHQYEYSRRNIYLGTGVTLERGSRLEENVVVGKSCHIHAGTLSLCITMLLLCLTTVLLCRSLRHALCSGRERGYWREREGRGQLHLGKCYYS